MAKLEVLTAPHPILNQVAQPVDEVDNNIRKIMDDMLETMYHETGVGLAANQVGILKRIIVIDLKDDDEEIREKGFYPLFMANPEIIQISDDSEEEIEGCLSVPEQRVAVTRPQHVKVKYLDYNNKKQEIDARGWFARAVQHEIDHLNGKLMINYLSKLKKDIILRKLIKLKRNAA
ncbi:MAG: peptide deformylase [Rickettsiales bacterium]|nr:MAG: peptide deformylase [Rickettsiales bacterium]